MTLGRRRDPETHDHALRVLAPRCCSPLAYLTRYIDRVNVGFARFR